MALNTAGQTRTGNASPADSPSIKVGRIVLDATGITAADYLVVECGFTPKYVCVENITDRIRVEWFEGMTADTCVKTAAAGTRTLETTNKGIAITDKAGTGYAVTGAAVTDGRSFVISQNATLAVVAASKTLTYLALG